MNSRTGATGTKEHLYTTKVFWSTINNQVMTKVDGANTACNKMVQMNNKINEFRNLYKSNPDACCKKCVEKMNELLERAKTIQNKNI